MKQLALTFGVITLLLTGPAVLQADDVDDLKAANEQVIQAVNSLDAAGVAALVQEGGVSFGLDNPFPLVAPAEAELREYFQQVFDVLESLTVTPINLEYRVFGDTGIVWGHSMQVAKPRDGPVRVRYVRSTHVYVKSEGKWLWALTHASAIPSGD